MRFFPLASLVLLCVAGLAGCRSRFVEATIVNQGPVLHVMEFDYPSASFGANVLATRRQVHYRFKIQGSGPLSLQYEDGEGHTHTATGPNVDLGDQGSLLVTISPAGRSHLDPKSDQSEIKLLDHRLEKTRLQQAGKLAV